MVYLRSAVGSLLLLSCITATAKDKKKIILPADVLQAQTVLVVIDPDTGQSIEDPLANRTARDNVEKALMNWGRFRLVQSAYEADLIIVVRKGSGKMVQPTIGGIPQNDRPVIFQPSDTGPRVGGERGSPPPLEDPTRSPHSSPHPQLEGGQPEDMFAVYRGQRENALDSPAVWRYTARDAFRSPGVPAVEEFRKTIVEAEKQQAKNP